MATNLLARRRRIRENARETQRAFSLSRVHVAFSSIFCRSDIKLWELVLQVFVVHFGAYFEGVLEASKTRYTLGHTLKVFWRRPPKHLQSMPQSVLS